MVFVSLLLCVYICVHGFNSVCMVKHSNSVCMVKHSNGVYESILTGVYGKHSNGVFMVKHSNSVCMVAF